MYIENNKKFKGEISSNIIGKTYKNKHSISTLKKM